MVRKSNYLKSELIQKVGNAVQLFQEGTDTFDDAAADYLGLNRTDLKCLGIIFRNQPISASEVARQTGLTRGATTTALDRIENSGYIRRVTDPKDGRGVLLELTKKTYDALEVLWGKLAEIGAQSLEQYSAAELECLLRFLEEGYKLQTEQAARVRSLKPMK
jgi:DNA-binding MarR family transcriptional regulator